MVHAIYKVISFEIVGDHLLDVKFDDGTSQLIDLKPVLFGELYGPLRDLNLFNKVKIDSDVHTLVWPNGADFEPATLHDWDTQGALLQKQAAKWELIAA